MTPVTRKVLVTSKEFKAFWKDCEPFSYALTSQEFPPVLLEPEEWLFSDNLTALLKELMGYGQKKMKVVAAPFNPKNKNILRPDDLIPWKINNFPDEWNHAVCDLFVPEGGLTRALIPFLQAGGKKMDEIEKADALEVESAFFRGLETCIDQLGYLLLKPRKSSQKAFVQPYLEEWEKDERDAGFMG